MTLGRPLACHPQLKQEGESGGKWARAPGLLFCGLFLTSLVPTQPGFRTTLGRSMDVAATGGLEAVASVQTRNRRIPGLRM